MLEPLIPSVSTILLQRHHFHTKATPKGNLAISTDVPILYSILNLDLFILRDMLSEKFLSKEIPASGGPEMHTYHAYPHLGLEMLRLFIIFPFFWLRVVLVALQRRANVLATR